VQRTCGRHAALGGLSDHIVDPALDERESGLEPDECGLLPGCLLRLEQAAVEGFLQRLGVRWVDVADGLFDGAEVDRDTATKLLDRTEQVGLQPRHMLEEALCCTLTQRQVEQNVRLR
jgi:hypothetical protein